jgi:lysophospholipase
MTDPNCDRRVLPDGASLTNYLLPDGWPIRRFDWRQPTECARGTILFQGGRGDIIEKYLESFDHWHRAGWAVTAFDWRGQGGSGRVIADPHVGHIADFSVWVDDLAEFVDDWTASTPAPHIVMGHSMGGHIVLRALAERRIDPDAVVLIAPMLGFDTFPLSIAIARRLSGWMESIGNPERPAWKANERPALPGTSRQKFLTHDIARYEDELWWKSMKPELELGPPSWHWMTQAYRTIMDLEREGHLEAITAPLLMIGTDGDRLVSPAAIKRWAARIPGVRLKMFGRDVAHEILREKDRPRNEALAEIDTFLEQAKAGRA